MAQIDSPLKDLIESCISDFAAWLLKVEVLAVDALNVEFPGQDARVDRLFRVLLVDGRKVILHTEFQGRSSQEPIRFRMLDYITRIVRTERELQLHSVVFYIGEGVGALDNGDHQIDSFDGQPAVRWRYQVVHLWKIKAEELIALNRPGLSALVGLSRMDNPETVIPKVVAQIQAVPSAETRRHLLAGLIALIDDQEVIYMIRNIIKEDGLLMNTPFLREVRADARRSDVVNAIAWRYDPPLSVFKHIEETVATIADEETLMALLKATIETPALSDFQKILNDIMENKQR